MTSTEPSVKKTLGKNKILLLQILLLDLIGFSIIFPLIPELLRHYINNADNSTIDFWVGDFFRFTHSFLPAGSNSGEDLILIMGGLIASLYSFLQFLFTPYWGKLSDRYGRRPVLLITSAGLAVSYLIWFFSNTLTFFLLARIAGGIMAGNVGVATASMADMSSREERTSAMGMIGAAFGLGFITGPLLGGLASQINLMTYFPDAVFLHPFSFCALISFVLATLSALRNFTSFKETLPPKSSSAVIDPDLIKKPSVNAVPDIHRKDFNFITLIYFVFILMFSGFEFSLSFLYKLKFDLSPAYIGFIFLYSGMILVLGQGFLVRRLTAAKREKAVLMAGLILMPLPLIFLAYTQWGLWFSLLMLFPVTLGASLVQPALSGIASLYAPAESQGLAMGNFRSAGSLARAIGPGVSSLFFWMWGFPVAYAILTIFIFISFFMAMRIKNPVR
jgi:MFS family permease